jgi:hypothetical protein
MTGRPTENSPAAQSERISARTIWLLLAVAFIPLAVILYSVNDAEATHKAWQQACLAPEKEIVDVAGRVRKYDRGFYLQDGASSHYLGMTCDGRRAACLEGNPGKRLLDANLGQPASARLCDGEVLSYRVAGSEFYK